MLSNGFVQVGLDAIVAFTGFGHCAYIYYNFLSFGVFPLRGKVTRYISHLNLESNPNLIYNRKLIQNTNFVICHRTKFVRLTGHAR